MKSNNFKFTKKELVKYGIQVKNRSKKFKLKSEDAHNLYDLYWMVNSPSKQKKGLTKTLKINRMDKWFYNFTKKIEKVVLGKNIAFNKGNGQSK